MQRKWMMSVQWAAAAVALATLWGCSGGSEYQPIPVEEARAVHSEVGAYFDATTELLQRCNEEVRVVGGIPGNIRPQDFELDLVKSSLMSCFNATISVGSSATVEPRGVTGQLSSDPAHPLTSRGDMGGVPACNPNDMISLESYLDVAPDRVRTFIVDRLLLVDALRVNLKYVLQERLNHLEESILDTRGRVAQLRDQSRERYDATLANADTTAEQRSQTEADYEVIQSELEDIEALLDAVGNQLSDLRNFRRQLVEDVAVQLAAMGTPG